MLIKFLQILKIGCKVFEFDSQQQSNFTSKVQIAQYLRLWNFLGKFFSVEVQILKG
jgi:hypothetical protein